MGWLASALKALAETLGLINRRNELKNAPDVRDRAKAQQEADAVAKTEAAVTKGDLNELRKELAE